MPHPHKRTWTLGGLDRDATYGLFFNHAENRWDVVELDVCPEEVFLVRYAPHGARSEADLPPLPADWVPASSFTPTLWGGPLRVSVPS
jgi:hypothetical protein